ncbi:pimeloyl-ACP methyl ester carboxylesterase [Kribbella sp. VKM Ac-2500]|nr:pimeloyl-ACP methyl ester carboxylesterase [Kribbella sp. VKM Ac-2500]
MSIFRTPRRWAAALVAGLAVAICGALLSTAASGAAASGTVKPNAKPTVVLVHGAFADSSGWNGVVARLQRDGYPVIAVANPLRGVASDADYVRDVLRTVAGPVVLVGHSYGGSVITNAALGDSRVKALVYIAGFAPDTGESAVELSNKFPGSTLAATLEQIPLGGGALDLRVRQDLFPQQFAADVPVREARLMAVAQRPITAGALNEASGKPAWKTTPSYFLIPTGDKNIPPAAQRFMAERAHGTIVTVRKASHAVFVSKPGVTARLIELAARQRG